MSATDRMRRYRARLKSGRAIVPAEVDMAGLIDLLMRFRYLHPASAENFEEIRAATSRFLEDRMAVCDASTGSEPRRW